MPENSDAHDDSNDGRSRRSVLKAVTGGVLTAGLAAGVAVGKASADLRPEDCYYEYDCSGEVCQYGGYVQYRRQCCEDPWGYVCDDWEEYGCC